MDVKRFQYLPLMIGISLSVISVPGHTEITGYLKSIWLDTNTSIGDKESINLGVNRWRVTLREQIEQAQLWLSYDIEWRSGSYLETSQYALQQSLMSEPYWDLQSRWHRRSSEEGYHGLYRAYLKMPVGPIDIRVGRQQLNWSQTYLWSSFDRFNPYNPLQIEPDERQGVDAAQLIWNLPGGDNLELVSVGAHEARKESHGIRYRSHVSNVDIDYLIADFGITRSIGVAAAGQWLDAGWRFEATNNRLKNSSETQRERYNDIVFSIDYTFPYEWTVIGELLYRGNGADTTKDYDWLGVIATERINLAKHYVGLLVRKGFEPIAGVDVAWLYNLDDHSSAWIPSMRYSPGQFENIHIRAGIQFFEGGDLDEFGRPENIVFTELQWFY